VIVIIVVRLSIIIIDMQCVWAVMIVMLPVLIVPVCMLLFMAMICVTSSSVLSLCG
jgi:hypothetical protein